MNKVITLETLELFDFKIDGIVILKCLVTKNLLSIFLIAISFAHKFDEKNHCQNTAT